MKDLKLKDSATLDKLSETELKTEYKSVLKNLFELKMKLALGELKQTHLVKQLRKAVAVIKTIAAKKDFRID